MATIGLRNTLHVVRQAPPGAYLDAGELGEILLPRRYVAHSVPPGALLKPKDPQEYFRKLRFHQAAKSVRDYGIDA